MSTKKNIKKTKVWVISPASGGGKDIAKHLDSSNEIECIYSTKISDKKWHSDDNFVSLLDADFIDSSKSP